MLGLDRYLDAEDRNTEWWNTIASIFGNGVFTGAGMVTSIEPLAEGFPLWRGSRLAARMLRGEITALEELTEQQRFDLGLFASREEKLLHKPGTPVSEARLGTANLIRILADKLPASEMDALAAELRAEAEALEEVAGVAPAKSAAPADAVEAEANVDRIVLGDQEHVTNADDIAESETRAFPPAPATPAPTVTQTGGKPFPIEAGLPERPGSFNLTYVGNDGQPANVTFDIKRFLDSGSLQHVYELNGPPTDLPAELSESLHGKRLVLKLMRKTIREQDEDLEAFLPQTMTRQEHAWGLLNKGGKPVVPHAAFQVFEKEGFMLQEYLEFQEGKLERLNEELRTNPRKFAAETPKAKRVAIARLARQLGDANLDLADFNYSNIYLELAGGTWTAKILDPDFLVEFGGALPAGNEQYRFDFDQNGIKMTSFMVHPPRSGLEAQMLRLEQKGWLEFDALKANAYRDGGYLLVDDVREVLPKDWPYLPGNNVPPGPPPPTPRPMTPQDVQKGLQQLQWANAHRAFINRTQGPPLQTP